MLTNTLHDDINHICDDQKRTNPLLELARAGRATPDTFASYLACIRFLLSKTPEVMRHAEIRAERAGMGELAEFYRQKCREETGHDGWADDDLKSLGQSYSLNDSQSVNPALRAAAALIESLKADIDAAPKSYLGYILLSEYVTTTLGDAWMEAVESGSKVERKHFTSITKHIELDKEHVRDDFAAIARFVLSEGDYQVVARTLKRSSQSFSDLCKLIAHPN